MENVKPETFASKSNSEREVFLDFRNEKKVKMEINIKKKSGFEDLDSENLNIITFFIDTVSR